MDAYFEKIATTLSRAMGRPLAFIMCLLLLLVWAVTGPMFHFSDTWQLVINTGTSIITFLMVFLIQNGQNREGQALQAKLDELLRAVQDAQNSFIGLEHRSEKEIGEMREGSQPGADAPAAASSDASGSRHPNAAALV